MTEIIGREREQEQLKKIIKSKSAEFVAVYGRRRVGKTYLIRNFFKARKCLFFNVTGILNQTSSQQIYAFIRSMEETFFQNNINLKEPDNWIKAFEVLTYAIKDKSQKVILFFDELPWLASKKSGFLEALDYYWNHHWSMMPNLKLIVCGSAASWMIEKILNNKGGLHNRVTLKLPLEPFTLKETKLYLESRGFKYLNLQILELYMVLGGIPYYLNILDSKKSVTQNIDELLFHRKAPLLEEFKILYTSLFDNAEAYEEIIRIIASKRSGVTRQYIIKEAKMSMDNGAFNTKLKALETSGFIMNFSPYNAIKKGSLFRLIDEYSLFYLYWVEPVFSLIQKLEEPKNYWKEKAESASFRSWSGYAFEAVIFKHITKIQTTLNISTSSWIGAWSFIPKKGTEEEGTQIDLVFDRNDNIITLCEIKYTKTPYILNKAEAKELLKKESIFQSKTKNSKQINWVLITTFPPKETIHYDDIINGYVCLNNLL